MLLLYYIFGDLYRAYHISIRFFVCRVYGKVLFSAVFLRNSNLSKLKCKHNICRSIFNEDENRKDVKTMVKYEKSFKFEAIALSDIFGVAYTAGWLGIPYCTLKDWRRQYKKYGVQAFSGRCSRSQNNENDAIQQIINLKSENAELRKELETLKAALAIL